MQGMPDQGGVDTAETSHGVSIPAMQGMPDQDSCPTKSYLLERFYPCHAGDA